jgi:predicted DNA-binding transcriptional regulator YafY
MARGDQLTRQWRLVQLLSGRVGRTLAQLRAELRVSKRTVQRDIAVLERGGFPVVSEARNGTVFWRFIEGFRTDAAVSFTLPELMALYFSRGLLRPLQGTPAYDALQSAMQKIGAAVPAQGHNLLHELDAGIAVNTFGTKDYSRSKQVIEALTRGVMRHSTVEIVHAALGFDEAVKRQIDPYKLWYVNHGLYVVGHDPVQQMLQPDAGAELPLAVAAILAHHRAQDRNAAEATPIQPHAFQHVFGDEFPKRRSELKGD